MTDTTLTGPNPRAADAATATRPQTSFLLKRRKARDIAITIDDMGVVARETTEDTNAEHDKSATIVHENPEDYYAASIEHRFGQNLFIAPTRIELESHIVEYCRENWKEIATFPTSGRPRDYNSKIDPIKHSEIIETYFGSEECRDTLILFYKADIPRETEKPALPLLAEPDINQLPEPPENGSGSIRVSLGGYDGRGHYIDLDSLIMDVRHLVLTANHAQLEAILDETDPCELEHWISGLLVHEGQPWIGPYCVTADRTGIYLFLNELAALDTEKTHPDVGPKTLAEEIDIGRLQAIAAASGLLEQVERDLQYRISAVGRWHQSAIDELRAR